MMLLASNAFWNPGFICCPKIIQVDKSKFRLAHSANSNTVHAASPVNTNIEQFCSLQFTSSAKWIWVEFSNISVVFSEWVDAPQVTKE